MYVCVCVYICCYLSVVYIRRCFHIYVYYGINCIVTQTERQTDTQSQAEPHRNRSSGCATVPPPAGQLSDSSSQVHKSQINQKAAGRTRELQPLQLLLSPDSIRADPIRSDPIPAHPMQAELFAVFGLSGSVLRGSGYLFIPVGAS